MRVLRSIYGTGITSSGKAYDQQPFRALRWYGGVFPTLLMMATYVVIILRPQNSPQNEALNLLKYASPMQYLVYVIWCYSKRHVLQSISKLCAAWCGGYSPMLMMAPKASYRLLSQIPPENEAHNLLQVARSTTTQRGNYESEVIASVEAYHQ